MVGLNCYLARRMACARQPLAEKWSVSQVAPFCKRSEELKRLLEVGGRFLALGCEPSAELHRAASQPWEVVPIAGDEHRAAAARWR